MNKPLKKHHYLFPFPRLFAHKEGEPYESILFKSSDSFADEQDRALAAPDLWSAEAISVMAQAACLSIPADLQATEENTVPSWLWHHQPRSANRVAEGDVRDIIDRITGSAAAKAWKIGLLSSEKHARAFTDEIRYAFMQRHIAIEPAILAGWGLAWAYGITEMTNHSSLVVTDATEITLANTAIDSALGKNKDKDFWKKTFALHSKDKQSVSLRLADTSADWGSASNPARAAIDLMALRHNDGSINIDAVRQAARLLTILFDLQDCRDVTIGFVNLAPLLLALGLAYDSDAARAMAASLAALLTAECYATSAELACLRGASEEYSANRDSVMRSLRNHHRAVYGDKNDYEKLSVLPSALPLKNCPDLALAAEAQKRWDDALEMARAFGLRATRVTDLTPSTILGMLMNSASQGVEPMHSLTIMRHDNSDIYHADLNPALCEALTRLGYARVSINAVAEHIIGARSLRKTPIINHASLRAKGMTSVVLEKIDAYLSCVNSVRLAVTPWIIGVDFCVTQLKIPARKLESPIFDLLRHLGFTDSDIAAANLYCYGSGTLRNAKILDLRHRPLFACGNEIATDVRLRMASAVQSFISGDTGMVISLPLTDNVEKATEATLAAWRSGLKSLRMVFDPEIAAQPARQSQNAARRIKASAQPHAKAMPVLTRQSRSKKPGEMITSSKRISSKQSSRSN